MTDTLRIGTRQSPLALWQAHRVRDLLIAADPELTIELVGITTEGDRILDKPLASFGGKGLFLKELESALLDDRVDIAVHSMKDVTVIMPDGLVMAVVLESADPRDAFVSGTIESFAELPHGARVGTSSLRRRCQILKERPDIDIVGLRGNINTRLAKLDAGDYDAIVLAVAGLERLEMHDRIRERLDTELCLPAIGQGIVGVQCRVDDPATRDRLAPLNSRASELRLAAERQLNSALDGGCHMPLAGFAEADGEGLRMRARLGMPDGTKMLEASGRVDQIDDAQSLGRALADDLVSQGAQDIIAHVAKTIGAK